MNNIYELLKIALNGEFSANNIKETFGKFLSDNAKLKVVEKGTQYITNDTSVRNICLLLSGKCHAINYTVDGKAVVVNSMSSVQLLGIYELFNGIKSYSSSVKTITKCYFIEVPVSEFESLVHTDLNFANIVIKYMAKFVNDCVHKNYMGTMNNSIQNFVIYLYNLCSGKTLPYKIKTNRKTMASELNVSLRTIYRNIDELKDDGIISINSGKIVISEEQFDTLKNISEKLF